MDVMRELVERKNFVQNDYGSYECEYTDTIWGNEAEICALYEGNPADMERTLEIYAGQLNVHIQWIQDHKDMFMNAILEDGMLETARDWLEDCALVTKDGETYYDLEEGEQLLRPLTEQDFLNSLYIGGMNSGRVE